ncbi:hypothetical protein SAMN05443377_10245 [Propionibacterium cyclohexanicum]|uniref:Uncharacterized protein n=1 Tax=Propionibacterium cyclohexanicum TaxID=64702 RepID=A0A1H9PZF6_9ACTN|nr:permease prefix domain 1-containing protein [Propionibacterium cyclohexanicum]SER53686.1 hypothetical protein SAMN05443377_10245 [Propionibacterium cyclohexanicum]
MTSYTERYVAAVTRTVPPAARRDVGAELSASITDQVEARIADGESLRSAERAVLVELGDPLVLASRFTDRPLWVVGPRLYASWVRLLRALLWIILPLTAAGMALGQLLAGASIGATAGGTAVGVLQTGVHIVFWTTLVFFVLERAGATESVGASWEPEQLPQAPEDSGSVGELVGSLVASALFAGAIVWDRFLGWNGEGLCVFASSLWPWWMSALFVALALSAAIEVLVFRRRGWTIPTALGYAVVQLAVTTAALVLLGQGMLLDAALVASFDAVAPSVRTVLGVLLAGGIAGVGIASVVTPLGRAITARARPS